MVQRSAPASSLRRYPDPRSAPWARFSLGVDLMNTLLEIRPGFAQKMDNWEYTPDTLRRRKPFTPLLLGNGSQLATDYTSRGPFALAHEYVDSAGSARLLHAHTDGTIQELDRTAGGDTQRVSGLTTGKTVRFESFMGACIACNGVDTPRRADDTAWRTFGAPAAVSGLGVGYSATGLTGTWQYIVVACIQVGGVTVVRADWSNIVTATPANQKVILTWSASADARVNAYEVYRSFQGLGYPYYLVTTVSAPTVTYTDSTADAALSGQVADEAGRDGPAPVGAYVTSAGKRVVFGCLTDATDPDAGKSVWCSVIATNKYECEYFPANGVNKIRMPGKGPVTCVKGVGTSEGQEAGSDLFIAQLDSCYLLPQSNPLNQLQVVSSELGVINNEAAAAWGKWLFFVSLRGLEFLGPTGAPILISSKVNCLFLGGGEAGYNGNQGSQYITLRVADQALLITTRQDSGKSWGDTTLVLDLTSFQPYNSDPQSTARFTVWNGPGMGFFLYTRDRALLCFDNQNYRLLQRGTGAYDYLAGVATPINAQLWSGQILGEAPEYLKTLSYIELLQISDSATTIRLEGDYSASADQQSVQTVSAAFAPRKWDKTWDKGWFGNTSYGGGASLGRNLNARLFQFKLTVSNNSQDYTFIGFVLHYRQVLARIYGLR